MSALLRSLAEMQTAILSVIGLSPSDSAMPLPAVKAARRPVSDIDSLGSDLRALGRDARSSLSLVAKEVDGRK